MNAMGAVVKLTANSPNLTNAANRTSWSRLNDGTNSRSILNKQKATKLKESKREMMKMEKEEALKNEKLTEYRLSNLAKLSSKG
ncbi:hypothetical protein T4D_5575 [Trichinella pseudospiralis]|uniref:Uncharacterized protein n=1 Tax=Trichinella pseudospiralis TaxID=6337 RepID=A0A0V1FVX3_TRIPS|nr:hypothetical protein T4D_5575 [Trichinella pseudospiralis]